MKFTREDLMKAMGLSMGDRIKITMQFYGGLVKTGIYEVTEYGSLECLPNQDKKDLIEFDGCKIETLINEVVDYEILPRTKRVGDMLCDEKCNSCPIKIVCNIGTYTDNWSLYEVLKDTQVEFCDQEIYDLLKARLDNVIE